MIVDAVQRAILISFSSSYYDFELNVCAQEHLSFVIHLHFDLLYIFFKETKGKKKESAKAIKRNSYSISIHSYELLIVTTLGATLFLSFCHTMWCRYHSLRSNHNTDNRSRHVGVVSLYLLLSFNIDSLSFMAMMELFLVIFFFRWKIYSYQFLKTHNANIEF